jgi:outer membrane murein-binding lipoprotein Lpp
VKSEELSNRTNLEGKKECPRHGSRGQNQLEEEDTIMKTKKEEYIDKMANELKEWSANLDELESKVSGTTADVKAGYEARIRELKDKRDSLSLKLHELRESSGDAWETFKTGVDNAREDLKAAYTSARDRFKKAA